MCILSTITQSEIYSHRLSSKTPSCSWIRSLAIFSKFLYLAFASRNFATCPAAAAGRGAVPAAAVGLVDSVPSIFDNDRCLSDASLMFSRRCLCVWFWYQVQMRAKIQMVWFESLIRSTLLSWQYAASVANNILLVWTSRYRQTTFNMTKHSPVACLKSITITTTHLVNTYSLEEEFRIIKKVYHEKILKEHPVRFVRCLMLRRSLIARVHW